MTKKFDEQGVVKMKADWTRRDPSITTKELQKFGRSGVPLYLYFDGKRANLRSSTDFDSGKRLLTTFKSLKGKNADAFLTPHAHISGDALFDSSTL